MKYYQAILALASAAGFDVLEDAERMQTILPEIFQADEELRMENPLMRQALADALSMWKKQMWGGQFAVLFLHPKQTSLSIYDEHKHLVFTKSIEHGGLDIRKAVEAALPSDKKEFARKLCLQFGSLISSRSQTLRLGENFTINTLTLSQVMCQQMDAIMREFVPVFEDGTFHIGQFLIAGEGIGVDGMYDYGRNFVEDKLKLPIAVDFLLVPDADWVDGYVKNYYPSAKPVAAPAMETAEATPKTPTETPKQEPKESPKEKKTEIVEQPQRVSKENQEKAHVAYRKGVDYFMGEGVAKDYAAALQCFQESLKYDKDKDSGMTYSIIADIYWEGGYGVKSDAKIARKYYAQYAYYQYRRYQNGSEAAVTSLRHACYKVALCEMNEIVYNEPTIEQTLSITSWLMYAAKLGSEGAKLELERAYKNGLPRDTELAEPKFENLFP